MPRLRHSARLPFRYLFVSRFIASALILSAAMVARADDAPKPAKPSKFKPFAEVTKDAEKTEGLFDLYQQDDHLYAVLKSGDMGQQFLVPMAIARGVASAGTALNFGEEWVISFKRVGDRVQLIRKNLRYEAPEGTPLAKAVEQNYTDSVLMALPIISDDAPGGGVLIDFSDIFLTNFADLPIGSIDRSRSSWHKIKGFPNNVELQAAVTFDGGRMGLRGDDSTIDSRGVTIVLHYSFVKLNNSGYKPRYADQRVGHFLSATKDFGSDDPDTTFVRRINRWRLEKANEDAELSPPKKQIVWWVEDTVPHEYRPYVEEGILEWNKAFEKIGFRNALSVRWQNDRDEFDPEDTNYCTFRWITTPSTFAMSNLRSNPITGEMIDGDVIFDASWIRYWNRSYAYLIGARDDEGDEESIAAVGEIISPIMAARYGYGLPPSERQRRWGHSHSVAAGSRPSLQAVPDATDTLHAALHEHAAANGSCTTCQLAASMHNQFRMAAIALAGRAALASGGDARSDRKDDDKDDRDQEDGDDGARNKKKDAEKEGKDDVKEGDGEKEISLEAPEELIGQVIKEIVMHEVGHSLGLRHNFRASTMLDLEEVNDPQITRKRGMIGSVMDYPPINIAPVGEKQGDYATTTIGPYDYWAIEYAYKPIKGDEKAELKKIAARSPEAGLEYATDEDLYASNDPRVNVYDLGSDPLQYAQQRIALSEEVLKELDKTLVRDGESWARLRPAFLTILSQYGDASYLAMQFIGGREVSRDARGKDAHEPVVPVSGKRQRQALQFIAEKILVDEPIPMRPELLRRVTTEHWYHWGARSGGEAGVPYYDQVEAIQNIALSEAFGYSMRMNLIENNEAMAKSDDEPLRIEEVFRTFTDAIWGNLKTAGEVDDEEKANDDEDESRAKDDDEPAEKLELAKVRRNLQRLHLRYLVNIVLGPKGYAGLPMAYAMFGNTGDQFPAEARSLARLHLKEIDAAAESVLNNDELEMDDVTRAHLEEIRDQLQKVFEARFEAGDI